ncbi:MAG: GNAT family N-acetyltransferase [Ruminococcaceae bacterium]|nr:GNAT family N-acetyltransferase [Oscillospiraceae bacterium]
MKDNLKITQSTKVTLVPLEANDREQFILDNQWAFKHGAMIEFGERDDHIGDDGEIISRKTIERCIDASDSETYRIVADGRRVGGVILKINKETNHNGLEILFVSPEEHSKGIGCSAWQAVEALHPETKIWETFTPYFEKRNIHFYVNKCGFKIDRFLCEYFQPSDQAFDDEDRDPDDGPDEMFRFIKEMKI